MNQFQGREEKARRGTTLADTVRAIEDLTRRAQAVADIVVRWKEKGWWDRPTGGAAKTATSIDDELLKPPS